MRGRVVKALSGFFYVRCGSRVYESRARGLFKKEGMTPLVGDEVEFRVTHEKDMEAFITEILPRRNSFIRPPAANVDMFCVVVSAGSPAPNTVVTDKMLMMAEQAGTEAMICVNKTDEADEGTLDMLTGIYSGLYPIEKISAKTGDGIRSLAEKLYGKRTAFAGASGVGKSTLVNALLPEAGALTGSVSRRTGRGRNTTRHVESFEFPGGGAIYDTPGFTAFEAGEGEEADLQYFFPEMRPFIGKCRFDDCRHVKEPGCAVIQAVEDGAVGRSRYDSYLIRLEEIRGQRKY